MNRNRLIAGVVILAVFTILMISGSILLLREWKSRQAQVDHRTLIPSLAYCSSKQVRPCILSFTLDSDRNMVINILTSSSSPPGFYIKIRHEAGETLYKCRKVKGFSTSVACTGDALLPGGTLQFLMISTDEEVLLAEGHFPMIGLAIATPEIAMTPTPRVRRTPPYR